MRVFAAICLGLTVWAVQGLANKSCGQNFVPRIASRSVGADAPAGGKFTIILFWKQDDAATQKMSAALKASLARRTDRATSMAVNIADPANQAIVEQYKGQPRSDADGPMHRSKRCNHRRNTGSNYR